MLNEGIVLADRYEITGKIGTGGMSDVYKAKDHKLNRYVAIKVLKSEFSENRNFVSKFHVEAQSAAVLMHPNIVNVYDVGEEMGQHYIVMELVEGITLKKYIEKKLRLSFKETISIAIQVSMGIESAHNNHIIHRDIKPQNIIISKEGKVKVTDFGIARAATSNTITSNAMGSVHYTSPEQARGGYSDEKSDIYSLGITMFEMLTGRVPYDGDTTVSIAIKHIQEEMPSPRDYVDDIPISAEQIIFKCCQKNAARRYQNMGELIVDLKRSLITPDEPFVKAVDIESNGLTRAVTDADIKSIRQQTGSFDFTDDLITVGHPSRQRHQDDMYADENYNPQDYNGSYDPQAYDETYNQTYDQDYNQGYGQQPVYDNQAYADDYNQQGYDQGYDSQGYAQDYNQGYDSQNYNQPSYGNEYVQGYENEYPPTYDNQRYNESYGQQYNQQYDSADRYNNLYTQDEYLNSNQYDYSEASNERKNGKTTSERRRSSAGQQAAERYTNKSDKRNVQNERKKPRKDNYEDSDIDPGTEKIMGVLAIIVAIIIAIIAIVIVIKVFSGVARKSEDPFSTGSSQEMVTMISLTGKSYDEAKSMLRDIGLDAQATYVSSPTVEANQVMGQNIEAGASVARGAVVELTVSSGTDGVVIPDVAGLSEAEARVKLEGEGFVMNRDESASEDVPKGNVISQNPMGGETAVKGSTVTIYVSTGHSENTVTVPDLRLQTEAGAKDLLTQAGLNWSTIDEEYSDVVPMGCVTAQSYSPGVTVTEGTSVSFTLSLGPQALLYKANLSVTAPSGYMPGTSAVVTLTQPDTGTVLFSTTTSSFPVAININNITGTPSAVLTVTYPITNTVVTENEDGTQTSQVTTENKTDTKAIVLELQ